MSKTKLQLSAVLGDYDPELDGTPWSQLMRRWIISQPGFETLSVTDTVKKAIECFQNGVFVWFTKIGEDFDDALNPDCDCEPSEISYIIEVIGNPCDIGLIQRLGSRLARSIRKFGCDRPLGDEICSLPIQSMCIDDVDDNYISFRDQYLTDQEVFHVTISFIVMPYGDYE